MGKPDAAEVACPQIREHSRAGDGYLDARSSLVFHHDAHFFLGRVPFTGRAVVNASKHLRKAAQFLELFPSHGALLLICASIPRWQAVYHDLVKFRQISRSLRIGVLAFRFAHRN